MQRNLNKDISRYARQIILKEVGSEGQQRLTNSRVLVIGAGGLGCPVLLYLAGAGVGTIGIVDDDIVDLSNLHRQVLYGIADVGHLKVLAARLRIQQLDPNIIVNIFSTRLDSSNAIELLAQYDIIVDATDNFDAKYLINDACNECGKPMVYASISQFEGQVSVFNYYNHETLKWGPSFRDLFESPPPPHLTQNCSEAGVLGVVPGLIGCIQANEVLKLILSIGSPLSGELLSIDWLDNSFNLLSIEKKDRSPHHIPMLGTTSIPTWDDNHWLEPVTLHAWITEGKPFELIDVREVNEHQESSLEGKLIPLREIISRHHELSTSLPMVFYCTSGTRSKAAVMAIRSVNQQVELYSLSGGIERYSALYPEKFSIISS